jgi:peptidoglycan/xylan/chitin deacetylase (PgdA/CDA1 family)
MSLEELFKEKAKKQKNKKNLVMSSDEIIPYNDFRTGLDFRSVYLELKIEQRIAYNKEGRRMFITRHTVLGRWHEIKKAMYKDYLNKIKGYKNQ